MAYNPEKLVSMGRMSEILARTKQEYENKITTEAGGARCIRAPRRTSTLRTSSVIEAFFHPGEGTGPQEWGMCSW